MLNRAVWAWAAVWAMEVSRFKGEPSVCNQHPIICQPLLSHDGYPVSSAVHQGQPMNLSTRSCMALTSAPSLAARKLTCSWSSENIMLPKSFVVVGKNTDFTDSRLVLSSWALTAPIRHNAKRALQQKHQHRCQI